jgi:flagellar biosynthetic protein FliR
MIDPFHFDPVQTFSFTLTLMRVSIVLFMLPIFGANTIPTMVKAALSIVLSMAIWPQLSFPGTLLPSNTWAMALMFLGELIMGLLLDILVRLLFAAAQSAGAVMGFSMGFSLMNTVDPLTGAQESGIAHLMSQVVTLLFLPLNGHIMLLGALAQSFALVPPGSLRINASLGVDMVHFTSQLFVMAVKIAAPVMASIFLVDLALALVARAAPQMNVLFIGFPLKIGVGFLFMTLVFAVLAISVSQYITELGPMFVRVLQASH